MSGVKKTLPFLGASAWIVAGVAFAQLPVLELSAGIHLIRAEVANTFETRAELLTRLCEALVTVADAYDHTVKPARAKTG